VIYLAKVSDLGIDLGTSNILIYQKGSGIILREPTVVAIDYDSRELLAVGEEAYRMIGRTPGNVVALRPLRNGSVNEFDLCRRMLQYFVNRVIGKRIFSRPRAVLSLPSGVFDIEKRALISAMFDAGMRKTDLLDRPVAAALGAGLAFEQAYGTMVVDIGAGATDIAVLSLGQSVISVSVPHGGDQFNEAIIKYLRRKYNLLIGERTAEELKVSIGCVVQREGEVEMDVTGRHLVSGLPTTKKIKSSDVYEAMKEPTTQLIEAIQGVLEKTPPQLASDVFTDGILLTGGGARLEGLSEAVFSVLHVPCGVASDPQTSVVQGCGRIIEDMSAYKYLL